ncbi:BRD4-interacting chromatin-remodeling complex-associated protein isoform X2 [Halichoeres trimaculatus]|uniref:BRD4-interacting chromatin-remodeling complex-associated protein isoform X2 n=1 Tax=Halichoeres trimaculatus TaxID=147232 RepID=UPI003D9E2BB0
MDDEDGRCLLDVICDPEALNDFLHGSETHLDTDDLLDGSSDPSSSFFSTTGGHVTEVQPAVQLSANESAGLPRVSVDLDFLEDDDILGGSPGGEGGSNGIGTNHEPCDILQQSLAEANITEQSLQEAEAELDLGSFGIPGLTQVVQTLPDASLSGAGGTTVGVGIGVGVGGAATLFPGSAPSTTATPPNATADMLGSVLAQQGLQLQPQVMNKAISVQPFMQPVGLGNVTLQPISSLQALPNGSQSGHLGIGQIQVVGQPTVMTINQSGQPILAKAMGGYQLHQSGPEVSATGSQAALGGSGGGLLIQGNKPTLGSPALNGPAVCVTSTNSSSGGTMTAPAAGLVGFSNTSLSSGIGPQTQTQGQIMQNVIIQRTPTPIQPKPPQGGAIQPKLFKQQPQQQPQQTPQPLQNDAHKTLGLQQVPVSTAQNVAFLTGKPGSNVVLSAQGTTQGPQFQQTIFKQQGAQPSGKPLSVHLLNQSGSIVIPSQTVLQGQNHQFLLPQLQAGGQILTQHPGGHIITSQGPGGQLIANQILTANQNINLGQVLTSQGHPGAAHILSGPIQLQPGQMGTPTLFQMPVSLGQTQTQTQTHTVSGHAQTVIQGMPIQNSLTMLSQVEGLSPAVSLQPALQPQPGGVPSSSTGAASMAQGQPGECVTVLSSSTDQAAHPTQQHVPQSSILAMQPSSVSAATTVPSSSPSMSVSTSSSVTAVGLVPPQAQHSPGRLLFTNQGSSMILSQESLQMFLQQEQHHQTENESTPTVGVPASVIVSSNNITAPAPAVHDSQLTDSWVGQSHSPSPGPSHMTAVVKQVPSGGQKQPLKIQGMSPSPALTSHTTTTPVAERPQSSQSPLTLSQQIQSPHHQQQSHPPSQPQPQTQTSSRACTPSSHPPLFIVHNQIPESSQTASQGQPQPPQQAQAQQAHIQVQLQTQPRQASQPAPYQQDMPPVSQSPKPPHAPPAPHQFPAPPVSTSATAVVKAQVPVPGLTAEQQHHLQIVGAQIQTLSGISQPSPQQKQLLDKLHQVQQNILLQAKQSAQSQPQPQPQPQPQTTGQFSSQQDVPVDKVVIATSSSTGSPAQLLSVLQPASVLVKTPATASSDLQVFSGAQGPAGSLVNQTVTPASLTQPAQVQPKPGVISSVGGMTLGKAGMQIQVLGTSLTQMPAPQPPAPVQTQTTTTMKMPFSAEPSKEARMLEQLRKQQGSVLHPNYSAPFHSFEDTLHRLLPYHVYQGTANSSQDYQRVDDEFEKVSCHLLKRTQAMLDKYRHLLFTESKRLGPSAEMVMIDRMFIQEEKIALSQDRVLARERPEEFVANARMLEGVLSSQQKSSSAEPSSVSGGAAPAPAPAPAPPANPAPPSAPASDSLPKVAQNPSPAPTQTPAPASAPTPNANPAPPPPTSAPPVPLSAASSTSPFPPTKLVIKHGGGGASVSWSSSCPPPPAPAGRLAEPTNQSSSSGSSRAPGASSSLSSSSLNSKAADDDVDALPQRTSKPPMKTYEARQRIGLKLKIKQDQTGFSKVVHNTALDPVHTPQIQQSSQSTSQPQTQTRSEAAVTHSKSHPSSTSSNTVIRTQSPVCTAASASSVTTATTQSNQSLRGSVTHNAAPSSSTTSSHTWSSSSSSSTQMNGTLDHHSGGGGGGGVKHNSNSTATPSQTTCRLPLRKTYRENVSPRVRPGVPGGGDESFTYRRPTPSPPRHEASSPPSERTVIASVKVEKRSREASHIHTESSHEAGRFGSAMQGLDDMDVVFNRGIKTTQHHLPQLLDREGTKERGEEHADQETDAGKYKRVSGKNRHRAGGTFRMDQHAPGPPSPESSFTRDSLLPAKRCKSDSPDMDNASFSSGSPPDDSLNEHLQCAIDSILNLQQEPSARGQHIKGGNSRSHQHQSQRPGGSAASSHRPSVPPSSSSSAQHPQVGGRGHNGSLVPQTQSR